MFVAGACDIEESILSYKLYTEPELGQLTLENNESVSVNDSIDGSIIVYKPYDDLNGADEFKYEVCDSEGACSIGLVHIDVENVNDAPTIEIPDEPITLTEDQNGGHMIELLGYDIDNDALTYQMVDPPLNGTCSGITNNYVTYIPNQNYFGNDSFTFSVSDGISITEATYTLTITSVNDIPEISGDFEIAFNEGETGSTLVYSRDEDNFDGITSSNQDQAFTIFSDNSMIIDVSPSNDCEDCVEDNLDCLYCKLITFTPNDENFFGNSEFELEVSDGLDLTSQIINVIVYPVNDSPVINNITNISSHDCINNPCFFNEDESFELYVEASDIDDENLTYSINEQEYFLVVDENGSTFELQTDLHFYGELQVPFTVCDSGITNNESDPLCDEASILISINSVNDSPRAKKMTVQAKEDCLEEIDLNIYQYECNENLVNGILCDCDNEEYTTGVCDIESTVFEYEIVSGPNNGSAYIENGKIIYAPDDDYISGVDDPDIIQYRVIDDYSQSSEIVQFDEYGECIDIDNCPIIEIYVNKLNDSPIINCPGELIGQSCEVSLNNLLTMYEDCSQEEAFENTLCDDSPGVLIDSIRSINSTEDGDICSEDKLWYDPDCSDIDADFGIVVDVSSCVDNNQTKGVWKYKENDSESDIFIPFDLDGNCNYKLLDKNDQIKFYPNSNYYTTDNLESIPRITFYAWDKSEYQIDEDGCISSIDTDREECGDNSSFSEDSITLSLDIISVNDTPDSGFIDDLIVNEYCPLEDNPSCNSGQIIEVPINFTDLYDFNENYYSDDMYYLVSSNTISNNSTQSLFENLELSDNFLDSSNIVNENLEFNQEIIEQQDGLILKLKLTEYANGEANVTIVGFDRENFEESLYTRRTFKVTVNQVNNKIKPFDIVQNIYEYDNYDYQNIVNHDMIFPPSPDDDDVLYIKYPTYEYENTYLNINDITAETVADIRNYMRDNPYEMGNLFFMWSSSSEGEYLDYDLNPMLNADPYDLYFRLEFLDQNGNVYVLKDSIQDNFSDLDYGYTTVKLTGNEYKKYIEGEEIYNSQTLEKGIIDTTGLTFYNWRIVADNYAENFDDIVAGYDFYNTVSTTSENAYGINLLIPNINYDFVLNDIYTNYFDMYISSLPISQDYYPDIFFNTDSEVYLNYFHNGYVNDETLTLELLEFGNDLEISQNIFRSFDDFNEFGSFEFNIPIQNSVETMNIVQYSGVYQQVEPQSYTQLLSENGVFILEIISNSGFNILIHEKDKGDILLNNNVNFLSDFLIVNASSNYLESDIKIKFDLEQINQIDNNITFVKYADGLIEKIDSRIENDILVAEIDDSGAFGIVSMDDDSIINENPYETKILSSYPNPFNPYVNISYKVEKDDFVEFEVYNIQGKIVFESGSFFVNKGLNQYRWNGYDNYGTNLSSGVYLIAMKINNKIYSHKVTLLK